MPQKEYFLTHRDPSLRLLALRELEMAEEQSRAIRGAKAEIRLSRSIAAVFKDMAEGGYWLQRNPRSGQVVGDGVEYGAYASTHYRLSYLAELGMDRADSRIAKAAERYLNLQAADGDFWKHLSCLLGLNIRTFAKLGYREDARVRKSIDLLLATERPDSGYLCDLHEKPAIGKGGRKLKRPKSCYRGATKALLAFAYFPEYRNHPRVSALSSYFLEREGVYKRSVPTEYALDKIAEPSFPITWSTDVVQVFYALARMGFGNDPRLERTRHLMESLRDADGFIPLAASPSQSPWKPGKRGRANDWLTLYADIAVAACALST